MVGDEDAIAAVLNRLRRAQGQLERGIDAHDPPHGACRMSLVQPVGPTRRRKAPSVAS